MQTATAQIGDTIQCLPGVESARIGRNVTIIGPVNIYGCRIGNDTVIGPFVEIQRGSVVGDRCKIGSHTFICSGVLIGDEVFVGHGVMFCNDKHPWACTAEGKPKGPDDWTLEKVIVRRGASIGTGAIILPGVEIKAGAMIGAGAVVTKSVAEGEIVVGNPARPL